MSTATQARPGLDRNLVERLVREALGEQAGNGHAPAKPAGKPGAPKLVVNVSARHCHVTQEDLERPVRQGPSAEAVQVALPGRLLRRRGDGDASSARGSG